MVKVNKTRTNEHHLFNYMLVKSFKTAISSN